MAAKLGDTVYFGFGELDGLLEVRCATVNDTSTSGPRELLVMLRQNELDSLLNQGGATGELPGEQPMRQDGYNLPVRLVYRVAEEAAGPALGVFWPKPAS
jgi:hypothetical protein